MTKPLLLLYHDGRIKPLYITVPRDRGIYTERETQLLSATDFDKEVPVTVHYIERVFGFLGETEAYLVYGELL